MAWFKYPEGIAKCLSCDWRAPRMRLDRLRKAMNEHMDTHPTHKRTVSLVEGIETLLVDRNT